jgi:hypothetical protein
MTDMDDEVRDSLQRRAEDIPPRREVPPDLGRRAGRRIAFNSLAAGAAFVVILAVAIVGIRALTSSEEELGGNPTPTSVHHSGGGSGPTPTTAASSSGSGVTECAASDLRANGTLLGAAGSREGVIDVANLSDTTCTLQGRPRVTLLQSAGHAITSGITFLKADAGWMVDGETKPAGWPVVTLHPGDSASVRVRWGNWCPQGRAAPLWELGIPGGGQVAVQNGMEEPPPCNGETEPSTVEVGPFEPHRAP